MKLLWVHSSNKSLKQRSIKVFFRFLLLANIFPSEEAFIINWLPLKTFSWFSCFTNEKCIFNQILSPFIRTHMEAWKALDNRATLNWFSWVTRKFVKPKALRAQLTRIINQLDRIVLCAYSTSKQIKLPKRRKNYEIKVFRARSKFLAETV